MEYIAYIRVSTRRQDYGLDAQLADIRRHIGCEPVAVYCEKESGKIRTRPELQKALAAAQAQGATLVVAKLDRLTRDAEFAFRLRNSGVDFAACDCPDLNTMTFGVMVTMAQYERELISQRTRAALAAAKARGVKLGSPKGRFESKEIMLMGAKARKEQAAKRNEVATKLAVAMHAEGKSMRVIAKELQRMGIETAKGGEWTGVHVSRLLKRAAAAA